MPQKTIYLASDNFAPAHPQIMQAISEANQGHAPAYGLDAWTEHAEQVIREAFKSTCEVLIVPTGTGANVLALNLACRRHESVICTDIAHMNYQESGAAESIVGCKLLTVPHKEGKASPEDILKKLKSERAFGRHSTSPGVLSITQPTEVGTLYTLDELKILSALCKKENLLLHMDGSRLYNAIVQLKTSFHEMTEALPLDLLSLGGTKNGLMGAEALLIFNPSLRWAAGHLQKQNLQLLSKMRYLSAQYIPFFEKDLWRTLAQQANQKAREIASIIEATPQLSLSYPVQSNQIFFTAPSAWIPLIREKIFCYPWNEEKNEIRFIASWDTSEKDVLQVGSLFTELSKA